MPRIYVDTLLAYGWIMYGKSVLSCHMYVSPSVDIEVLHAFAKKLGLKRSWFQNEKDLPHYDLVASMRKRAVDLGAIEVNYKHTAKVIKIYRRKK